MQSRVSNNILHMFDFTPIDALDPSLSQGHDLAYDRQLNTTIHIHQRDTQQTLTEQLRIKLLSKPTEVRLDVTSDSDLYFLFQFACDGKTFNRIKQQQNLYIGFGEYERGIRKTFERVEKNEQRAYQGCQERAEMRIVQKSELKDIELFSFQMEKAADSYIREMITFRYISMRSKWALMQNRLADINEIVKLKNPSLLLQIKKIQRS